MGILGTLCILGMHRKTNQRTQLTQFTHFTRRTHPMSLTKSTIDSTLSSPHGEAAYAIVEKLIDAGFDAWWVGGCVRDMLMDQVPHEIDIATSALPGQSMKLFERHDDDGAQFGSIIVDMKKQKIEVTTFREDDEASDGRHPESVIFGSRDKDAARRDLSINAMYFSPISRELFDPFKGADDVKERLIRFIGEPGIRIKHDALRMLRAVRFRATLDGQYHPETYRALQENAQLIDILSGSRQLEELEKMLLCPHPDRALEDLWELGILSHFLPELHACKGIPQPKEYHKEGDVWEHTLQCARAFTAEQGIDVRIAALFHDCGKAETFSLNDRIRFDHHATVSAELTEKAVSRLHMSKKRIEKISWLIKHHMMMGAFADMTDERKAHWYFHPWFAELLQLFWLDIAGTEPSDYSLYHSIMNDYHHFLNAQPRPPKALLSGAEVMEILGIQPGGKVGEILKQLHDAQVRKEVTNKKEARGFVMKNKN